MTEAPTVDVRGEFHSEPGELLIPGRLRSPLSHVIDDVGAEVAAKLGNWLFHQERLLSSMTGYRECPAYLWAIPGFEDHAPELAAQMRRVITEAATAEALEAIAVPEFEIARIELWPTLMHHGCHYGWHDDWPGADGVAVTTRRVAFDLFLHTEPKQFRGGAVEFPSGEVTEPVNGSLLLRHPLQAHRIHEVTCRSAETLHGRWSISGWMHGNPPDGWIERVERLRSIPGIS